MIRSNLMYWMDNLNLRLFLLFEVSFSLIKQKETFLLQNFTSNTLKFNDKTTEFLCFHLQFHLKKNDGNSDSFFFIYNLFKPIKLIATHHQAINYVGVFCF